MQLLLLYVLIDGLFFVFRDILVAAEAGKATRAVAKRQKYFALYPLFAPSYGT